MSKLTFYTVLLDKPGYPVKYLQPSKQYRSQLLTGPFADPGEASQEFQAMIGTESECCYLDATTFQRKANALAKMRRKQARVQAVV